MKQFKLGFVITLLISVAALAAPVDYFELGLGGHYMLDRGTFASPNNDVGAYNDVFKLQGDFGSGLSGHGAIAHQYTGPGAIIMKFDYYYAPVVTGELTEDELDYYSDPTIPMWVLESLDGERSFSFHTVTIGWRHEFSPEEDLHTFIDFGFGFTTASYSLLTRSEDQLAFEDRSTQTGFAANLSYGLFFAFSETLDFYGRADLNVAKIPDSRNRYNEITGNGPWTNALALNIGIRKWFSTPYPALRGRD